MTNTRSRIRGHVARILNTHQIAINVGSNDGVKIGMLFDVVYPTVDIVDPKTKEPLGPLTLRKKRLKTTTVRDRFSVATTLSKRVNRGGPSWMNLTLSHLYDSPRWETEYDTLEEADISRRPLEEDDSVVKVGDSVLEVVRARPEEEKEETPNEEQAPQAESPVAS